MDPQAALKAIRTLVEPVDPVTITPRLVELLRESVLELIRKGLEVEGSPLKGM